MVSCEKALNGHRRSGLSNIVIFDSLITAILGLRGGHMSLSLDYAAMLEVAIAEARQSLAEGGIPIGAALFNRQGALLGRGHNRRVQEQDPSVHG
jgi:hypothetical protein